MRNTKIVATLGPASSSPETIGAMLDAGANVFRLNCSHGTAEQHAERIKTVRELTAHRLPTAGILLDLQGPKIRLGEFEGGSAELVPGQSFTLTTEEQMGNSEIAHSTYADFARDVKKGDRVLLDDGGLELRVVSTDGVAAKCEVVSGGRISNRKGINLPGVRVSTPSLTRKDMNDLRWGLAAGVDMVALSFVRRREDLLRLRHFLEEHDARLPIIAKIEKPEAWERLDGILEEADGVMVARGDLGVELALEKVPFIQKSIIEKARQKGKFVITATQMLESMVENPRPTRAEVSDVANAIYDGTDAIMLSAETGAGKYPVESVSMMARIAEEVESSNSMKFGEPKHEAEPTQAHIVADAAYHAATVMKAAAIVVFTSTGTTARMIAKYRPHLPVLAFTTSEAASRQLSVLFGIRAIVESNKSSTDEMMAIMDRRLLELGWVKSGDNVVFVAGQPIGIPGTTNMMRLHQVL